MEDTFAPQEAVTEQSTPDVSQENEMTPETAFDQTQDKSTLVDEFFRANKIEEQPESEAPIEPSPVEIPREGVTAEPTDVDNDVKRYQYWQSEADKARNENAEMAQRLSALEQQAVQPQPEEQREPEIEQFPDPPTKPGKPRGFSRQDATDDPQSDSAQYLDEVDNWRDNMDEYNRLHNQYNQAVVQEERQKLVQEREDIQRAQADRERTQQNMSQMSQHLKSNYKASDEEVANFIRVMDDPKNITVDNLFQLYRMQNGGQVDSVQPVTTTSTNESFEQRKRAQQVPTPMGVVPSQSNSAGSGTDSVMDSMLSDYSKRNPFG
jgi:hypothetical protein